MDSGDVAAELVSAGDDSSSLRGVFDSDDPDGIRALGAWWNPESVSVILSAPPMMHSSKETSSEEITDDWQLNDWRLNNLILYNAYAQFLALNLRNFYFRTNFPGERSPFLCIILHYGAPQLILNSRSRKPGNPGLWSRDGRPRAMFQMTHLFPYKLRLSRGPRSATRIPRDAAEPFSAVALWWNVLHAAIADSSDANSTTAHISVPNSGTCVAYP